jgi:Co/Zn/Cd efflux system component
MSAHHHHDHDHHLHAGPPPPGYAAALWVALAVNALMFVVEVAGGLRSGSVSLLADAIDFFGDAANYAVSIAVLSLHAGWRARTALLKAASMAVFGVLVLGRAVWSALQGVTPEPSTMGAIGALALAANVGVAILLFRFREGDANMRSVWLCTRNDALGNVAVMAAALGVFGTGTAWPDLLVAGGMAVLALSAAWSVTRQARAELDAHHHA